jgi:hypothetical protein
VLRRLFNVLAVVSLVYAVFFGVTAAMELWRTPFSEFIFPPAVMCAVSLILPAIWFVLRFRPVRPRAGFPVLPAHEKTADESAVQGTSEPAKQ